MRSSHQMLRLVGDKGFDVVDQLVCQKLHGLLRCPSHMRRQNEIRRANVEQRVAVFGWLLRQHIEACTRDHAGF